VTWSETINADNLRAKFRWPVVPADRLKNSVENPRPPRHRAWSSRAGHSNPSRQQQRAATTISPRRKIDRASASLTGIGSPGRAQIDLFGTCYPDRLPIITRMHIDASVRVPFQALRH
jgi:hypothetical protein